MIGFFLMRPAIILSNLREKPKFIAEISVETRISYAHVWKVIDNLTSMGLVKKTKSGRKSIVELTDKGREVADLLHDLISKLKSY